MTSGNIPPEVRRAAQHWFLRLQSSNCSAGERDAFEHWRLAEPTLLFGLLQGFENQRHFVSCVRVPRVYFTVRARWGPASSSADSANSVSGPTMPSAVMP